MNAEQFRTRLANVLEGVPEGQRKPIQQFCCELRQGQQTLQERIAHLETELPAVKQDRIRLEREAAESDQKAAAVQQVLTNVKSEGSRLGKAISTQAETIAELKRCPALAIPDSVNLRKINYKLLASIANDTAKRIGASNEHALASFKEWIVKLATFHKLPKLKTLGEKLTREQLIFWNLMGYSDATFFKFLCARSPADVQSIPFKLLSDETEGKYIGFTAEQRD
jgi:SMC interacting uncharacterized protein involved in chromosome segregation